MGGISPPGGERGGISENSLYHCRNAGSGAQPQRGGHVEPPISKNLLLLSFYENKTYQINSGHILNTIGIVFPITESLPAVLSYVLLYHLLQGLPALQEAIENRRSKAQSRGITL